MTPARTDPAAPLRGTAVGMLTAALAVAAHGTAGGVLPDGAITAQLAVLAVTLGAVAATVRAADRAAVLWALLGSGQLLAHALLATADHAHAPNPMASGATMLVAHVLAVTVGAALIAGGARFCAAMSRAVRAVAASGGRLPAAATSVLVGSTDQPLHSALFLAASVSHRGPPVGAIA
ncbi:hypothetical protein AFM11_26560 [Mycolicibacterium wolinskyi]|uniref:Uncharacterized protein n=1 Tax=Mycolicibacterium wolinskyi TaxID=59750 RepID=A0A132PFU2_9MYCO|nr:hypothetical protein [Mycolicibacterium wolinskyi]KWX21218.1 hypothetical protein AFM11_26560 [Mycolicibacterium wolinskyi]